MSRYTTEGYHNIGSCSHNYQKPTPLETSACADPYKPFWQQKPIDLNHDGRSINQYYQWCDQSPVYANIRRSNTSSTSDPQYTSLPQTQPDLHILDLANNDQEIQLKMGKPKLRKTPAPPRCSECKSRRYNGTTPRIYKCFDCDRHQSEPRFICFDCELREFVNPDGIHKPTHDVQLWQPSWRYNAVETMRSSLHACPTRRDVIARTEPHDLWSSTFVPGERYEEMSVRCFVSAPRGRCRVVLKLGIKRGAGKQTNRKFDAVGRIRALVRPSDLPVSKTPPRHHASITECDNGSYQKKGFSIDQDDFSETRTLQFEVDTWQKNAIEIVLQSKFYDTSSGNYISSPFKWTLEDIDIVPIPEFENHAPYSVKRTYKKKEQEKKKKEMQGKLQTSMELMAGLGALTAGVLKVTGQIAKNKR